MNFMFFYVLVTLNYPLINLSFIFYETSKVLEIGYLVRINVKLPFDLIVVAH